jgi:hypothetical protein
MERASSNHALGLGAYRDIRRTVRPLLLSSTSFPECLARTSWLGLFSTREIGSFGQLVEGVIWNVVFAWIAAVVFGPFYNGLAQKV